MKRKQPHLISRTLSNALSAAWSTDADRAKKDDEGNRDKECFPGMSNLRTIYNSQCNAQWKFRTVRAHKGEEMVKEVCRG